MKSIAFLISASGGVLIVIFAVVGMKIFPGQKLWAGAVGAIVGIALLIWIELKLAAKIIAIFSQTKRWVYLLIQRTRSNYSQDAVEAPKGVERLA